MQIKTFIFKGEDNLYIFSYRWITDYDKIKGIVQIAHSMSERAWRYPRFARELTNKGYALYVKVCIFGHSMASFLLQRYICLHRSEINSAIFSGNYATQGLILELVGFCKV